MQVQWSGTRSSNTLSGIGCKRQLSTWSDVSCAVPDVSVCSEDRCWWMRTSWTNTQRSPSDPGITSSMIKVNRIFQIGNILQSHLTSLLWFNFWKPMKFKSVVVVIIIISPLIFTSLNTLRGHWADPGNPAYPRCDFYIQADSDDGVICKEIIKISPHWFKHSHDSTLVLELRELHVTGMEVENSWKILSNICKKNCKFRK